MVYCTQWIQEYNFFKSSTKTLMSLMTPDFIRQTNFSYLSKSINWALQYSYFSMEVNKKCLGSFLGIAICASSALFISVANVIVKHLSHMDPFLFSCIRYGTIAMMASPVTMSKGKEMWKYQVFCYTVK